MKQDVTQSLLEEHHNLCFPIYILIHFIPIFAFISDMLQHHTVTKVAVPGLPNSRMVELRKLSHTHK